MMLPISKGGLFGARTVDGIVFIRYTSLIKFMPEYVKPMSNRIKLCVDAKHI